MTILIYDYHDLEERASSHLRIWKALHTVLYILAAILGLLNYVFLQNTMELVDDKCVIYPRKLEFHWVELPEVDDRYNVTDTFVTSIPDSNNDTIDKNVTVPAQTTTEAVPRNNAENTQTVKRNAPMNIEYVTSDNETTIENSNSTIFIENTTHHLVLDTLRTLFAKESDCQFAEYMPVMSTITAILWASLFIVCPGGGRSRSGIRQPWRILAPALIFALIFVGLTGHSFTSTNGGLHAFCAAFYNVTNSTTCSSVNPFLERAWNVSWDFGSRVAATRAAAAGAWASWACVAALLLARCLTAPDFAVRRTAVYLTKDPHQKVLPHLKKYSRSTHSSPSKLETVSIKSEPTILTELVTASVEHQPDSEPTSLAATPVRTEREGEAIEMVYSPEELSLRR